MHFKFSLGRVTRVYGKFRLHCIGTLDLHTSDGHAMNI